jgi:acetyl esterase/lipase
METISRRIFTLILNLTISSAFLLPSSAQAGPESGGLDDPPWVKDVAAKPLVYAIPGMDNVKVEDLVYKHTAAEDLKMEVYRPSSSPKAKLPAILFIHGGFLPPNLKTKPTDWRIFIDYGRLAAASGFVGVTFNHRLYGSWASVENSASDLSDAISYVRDHADSLGVDKDRIALWAFSGGGPLLSLPIKEPQPYIRCLISYYALLDLQHTDKDERGTISDQALADYSPLYQLEVSNKPLPPIFIARVGQDMPHIKESVDRFLPVALSKNVTLTVSNDPEGHHGFDVENDSDASRAVIRQTMEFMKVWLPATN